MKIVTIVGARPQFIKAAVVSRLLHDRVDEIIVHTGQHYDHNMSNIFFEELNIPAPEYNLGISGGSHGQMTGRMIMAIEEVLIKERPDRLLVYGDTNSTLAAALAAVKLHIPICHVEAGNRLGTLDNPEEVNRICTDHISSIFAVENLDASTIYPVHPRNREQVHRVCSENKYKNIIITQPVGYLTSISLVRDAKKIITDSGGLQREAFFAEKQCVTVFDHVIWPETMVENRNQLAKPQAEDILKKLSAKQIIDDGYKPFGNGQAGKMIVDILLEKVVG